MPELPEVETVRRDLDKEVVGKRIKTVEVTGMRSVRRHPNKKHFIASSRATSSLGVDARASTCSSGSTGATCSSSTSA